MLDGIFDNENKYCFIINNTFHLVFFLSVVNNYQITKYILLINNINSFFDKGGYNHVLYKKNIKYKILKGDDTIGKFPFSIIDIFKYRKYIKRELGTFKGYKIFTSQDSTITNFLIIKHLQKNNNLLGLIDSSFYGKIVDNKKDLKYRLYKFYLNALGIKRNLKSGTYFEYLNKYSIEDIEFSTIKNNADFLKIIFQEKIKKIKKIKNKKNVIFLSQNLIDEYGIDKKIILNKLKDVCLYYEKLGYNFYIKPHPVENIAYYKHNFKIIDKTIPSEILDIYLSDSSNIFVTFFSSSILYITGGKKKLLGDVGFGINEKNIIKLLNKKYNINF